MLEPLIAASFNALPGIRHGFFTREGGVSRGIYEGLNCGFGSNDDPAHVAENRARVARHLNPAAGTIVTLHQVHSATALTVASDIPRALLPKADGIVTTTPGLLIGVLSADCTPVLFADAAACVIGAAHAGWRGATTGILEATIAEMEKHGARRANIAACIGPTISQSNYEVGTEFESALVKADPAHSAFLAALGPNGRAHFDLPTFVGSRLARAGLRSIERQTPCTYANESLFYSFRRTTHKKEPDYGRQISAIVLD